MEKVSDITLSEKDLPEGLALERRPDGLFLTDGSLSLQGDFTKLERRLHAANLRGELLVKAAKLKEKDNPTLFDATAGMGEDSLLLAAAGFCVTMCEYNPVIAALLSDTLIRAKEKEGMSDTIDKMELLQGDSISYMQEKAMRGEKYDVVYLDPMFPGRSKSGLIKKKFQLLQRLEHPCTVEADLFDAAKACAGIKIIVKRPLKGPYLANKKPDYSLNGKAIRVDVYSMISGRY